MKIKNFRNVLRSANTSVLFFGLIFLSVRGVYAQNGASVSANASATILEGISIVNSSQKDLAFGTIVAGPSSGSVKVAPNGTRTVELNGGQQLASSTAQAAQVILRASPNSAYTITLPSTAVTIVNGAGNVMTVSNFTADPNGSATLNTSGEAMINVGATLNINGNQKPGYYTGTFSVSFAY
jgi:hypothetical protein